MTNPFKQPEALWKIELPCLFSMLPLFEEYFSEITDTVSSYELESRTVESMPDDLWCFEAYFESEPDTNHLRTELTKLAADKWTYSDKLTVSRVENIDWVAQMHEAFQPLSVGRFFVTNPSHAPLCPEGMELLIMESSRAFGTGEHNTTKGCIEAMEAISHMDIGSVADIGTGTGILAIAAAKIWSGAKVSGSDIEDIAIEVSKQHAFSNEVEVQFEVAAGIPRGGEKVDLIVSNILKAPLIELAEDFAKALVNGGVVILSGFLDYQSQEVLDAYAKAGFKEPFIINKEGWITLTLKR